MASIKCPGCGREISSFAGNCNYCGHQISTERQNQRVSGNGGKMAGKGKFVAIALPIVIFVLAFIGRSEQTRLQQKAAQESKNINVPDFEDAFVPKEGTDTTEPESTDISELDIADAVILQERYLMYSDSDGDGYLTVYYGGDSRSESDIVKELLYEKFIPKDAVPDGIDMENCSLSDFGVSYEDYPDLSHIYLRDIGDYYLLTIDYPGLDDPDAVAEMVSFGIIECAEEGEHEGTLMDASSYMNSLEERGFEKGYFEDKEYSAYFGREKTAE